MEEAKLNDNTTNILDLILRLQPVIECSIMCQYHVPELYSIRSVLQSTQLTFYWLREADREMRELTSDQEVMNYQSNTNNSNMPRPLAITGTLDCLDFIKSHLTKMCNDLQSYLDTVPLPSTVKYKLEQAYNNLMEAEFNTEISTIYYDEIRRTR